MHRALKKNMSGTFKSFEKITTYRMFKSASWQRVPNFVHHFLNLSPFCVCLKHMDQICISTTFQEALQKLLLSSIYKIMMSKHHKNVEFAPKNHHKSTRKFVHRDFPPTLVRSVARFARSCSVVVSFCFF